MSVSYAVDFAALLLIGPHETMIDRALRGVVREALEGLRTVRQLRWLTTILAMETTLALLTSGPVSLGLPLLAWEGADRDGGAQGFGLLLAGLGLGHVIGMLAVAAAKAAAVVPRSAERRVR